MLRVVRYKYMKKRFNVQSRSMKVSVNLFLGFKFKEMNLWLNRNDYAEVEGNYEFNTLGLYFVQETDNKPTYVIWMPKFTPCREDIATLTHELHHVVERQTEEKGFECMETKAYLIEFYLSEVLKKYNFK